MIAAMNPCPCGFFGDPEKPCQCGNFQILQYHKKISGPILDRIDLHVKIARQKIKTEATQETSRQIQRKISHVKQIQFERFKNTDINSNAEIKSQDFKKYCTLNSAANDFFIQTSEKLFLSNRACHSLLKVSRTIADLNGNTDIQMEDLAEAIQFRKNNLSTPLLPNNANNISG